MTTRLVVLEIPEGSSGHLSLPQPDPTIEQLSRLPAERATQTVDDLAALATASPPVALRVQVGPKTLELTGTKAEAVALVLAAYDLNGRSAIDQLKTAIGRGVRPGQTPPPRPTGLVDLALEFLSDKVLDRSMDPQFREVIRAAERDLAHMVADDLVQLEDAASAVFGEALASASQKLERDRKELIVVDAQGAATFKTDDSASIVPRANALIDTCQAIAELDRQISAVGATLGILHDIAASLSPPLLATTTTPGSAEDDAEKLESIAKALSGAASIAGESTMISVIVSVALRAAAELARTAAKEIVKLHELLFGLVKSRNLLVARERGSFPFIDLALTELGSDAPDAATVAAATARALASYADALVKLQQELDNGGMSVLRGNTTQRVMDPFADERPHDEQIAVLDLFLATDTPEAMLAARITQAQTEGRVTVWELPQVVRVAIARLPETTLAQPAWLEVIRQEIILGKHELATGLGVTGLLIAGHGVAAALTLGMSEIFINIQFALDGLTGAVAAYARYTKQADLALAATYIGGGVIDEDPSLLPILLNVLTAVSSVAALARLRRLANVLDVAQLGILGFELAPVLAELFVAEPSEAN